VTLRCARCSFSSLLFFSHPRKAVTPVARHHRRGGATLSFTVLIVRLIVFRLRISVCISLSSFVPKFSAFGVEPGAFLRAAKIGRLAFGRPVQRLQEKRQLICMRVVSSNRSIKISSVFGVVGWLLLLL
jgi:hypothetical protein